MADTRTIAQRQRAARQDELREYIAKQRHEQQAVESISKMREASDPFDLSKWEKVFTAHMKLLDKYLPAQKEVAVDAVIDAEVEVRAIERRIVDPNG
jgi:hypothetical protein